MKNKKILSVVGACLLALMGCNSTNNTSSDDVVDVDTEAETSSQNDTTAGILFGRTLVSLDGSTLELNTDGTYNWYQDAEDKTDNFYSGSYSIYSGQEAVEAVADIEAIGLDEEEQLKLIEENAEDGVTIDDWFLMIQHREGRVVDKTASEETDDIIFVGFYYKDLKVYNALNCNTGDYAVFEVK